MRSPVSKVVLVATLLALAACQDPDVGQHCTITWGSDSSLPYPKPTEISADYFETGNIQCENLVCIMSPVTQGPYSSGAYCSKPCSSNQDCFQSDTGLVCRQIVLDTVFIAQLSDAMKQTYLGQIQFSNYCAVPE